MRALLSWILKNKIKDENKSCFLTFFLYLNHKDLKNISYNSSEYHFLGIFDSDKSKLQFQVMQTLNVAPLNVDPLRVLILTFVSKLFSKNGVFFPKNSEVYHLSHCWHSLIIHTVMNLQLAQLPKKRLSSLGERQWNHIISTLQQKWSHCYGWRMEKKVTDFAVNFILIIFNSDEVYS